jgi:hypothetical protein
MVGPVLAETCSLYPSWIWCCVDWLQYLCVLNNTTGCATLRMEFICFICSAGYWDTWQKHTEASIFMWLVFCILFRRFWLHVSVVHRGLVNFSQSLCGVKCEIYLTCMEKLNAQDSWLLGCDVLLCEWLLMMWRNTGPSSSESSSSRRFFLDLPELLDFWRWRPCVPLKCQELLLWWPVPHCKGHESSTTLPWEPQILWSECFLLSSGSFNLTW